MKDHRKMYPVRFMAKLLNVSAAGYYSWSSRGLSSAVRRRLKVETAAKELYYRYKKRYGAPRITVELNAMGVPCSKNFVASILRHNRLRARNGKSFRYRPAVESRTNVAENLLKRDFSADRPNQKWVTDITYIWVNGRWMYLAAVMDLYSRAVVGWAMAGHMTEDLVCSAIEMAFDNRDISGDHL